MAIKAPRIDSRRYSQMLQQIRSLVPFYTPEWNAANDNDFGQALLHIFSHLTEDIIGHLNRVPRKNFIAFLNMLGIELLPARPARVPVRFIPAPGTENGFLIPENTRLIAGATQERQEELPFETEESLFAIRSALLSLVCVDPEKDAIFLPPQGFMELELPAEQLPDYNMVSFSDAGSKNFQLDRVEGLEENDILRIPPSNSSPVPQQNLNDIPQSSAEHLVVSATSGNIVTTKDKISIDYPANTAVEKVTRFHLFDSKDWQEHVLYLGHPDLFSIKNEAQFTVIVAHSAGPAAGIEPLDLAWEYWGEKEGVEEEDWWEFDIQVDGSNGFSRDGDIVMTKGKGEIKETEINGSPSRWIRCRLKDKIPSTEPRLLPKLDHIKFLIKSVGDPVPADQAFYNDTPLDVNLDFFPFGTEPRMLDRFSLASEEIFSKKGAKINIKIEVADRGIMKTPTAVAFYSIKSNREILKVFSRSSGGRLLEVTVDPSNDSKGPSVSDWTDHGTPVDTTLALPDAVIGTEAQPAAVSFSKKIYGISITDYIWVFARAENGHLVERFYRQGQWVWLDHKTPPNGSKIKYDPSAVIVNLNSVRVCVVGEDNHLYVLERDSGKGKKWRGPFGPNPSGLRSAPYAVMCKKGGSFEVKAFVKTSDGELWEWSSADSTGMGITYGPGETIDSRPFAQCYKENTGGVEEVYAKVFVKDKNGHLQEFDTKSQIWTDLGSPVLEGEEPKIVISNPHGFLEYPAEPIDGDGNEHKHIFVIGSDHQLWERKDGEINPWVRHRLISGTQLNHSPHVIPISTDKFIAYSVFAETDSSSIAELRIKNPILATGKLKSDAENAFIEFENGSDVPGAYNGAEITVTDGNLVEPHHQSRIIIDYSGPDKIATVDKSWDNGIVPNNSFTYKVDTHNVGNPINAGNDYIVLSDPDNNDGFYKGLKINITNDQGEGQTRNITSYTRATKIAEIEPDWYEVPTTDSEYEIEYLTGKPQGGSNATIKLDDDASDDTGTYNGQYIRISDGPGKGQQRLITDYTVDVDVDRIATVDASWIEQPDDTSSYQLLSSSPIKLWYEYKDIFEENISPVLSWEYWNSMGWVAFKEEQHDLKDDTNNLLKNGDVSFKLPDDLVPTEVAGQENFWIRARIVSGDYGRETVELVTTAEGNQRVEYDKGSLRPPQITLLEITYELLEEQFPKLCLTLNSLQYIDQTDACRTTFKWFPPFVKLQDLVKTIYLGFEDSFEGSPIKLLFAAKELKYTEEQKPKLEWSFRTDNKWEPVSYEDATDGLIRQEILQLQIPRGFEKFSIFGQSSYWIKGSLIKGRYDELPVLSGVFPNITRTMQAETIQDEILGSSNGEEKQDFQFNKISVLDGEQVRVLEVLSQEEAEQLKQNIGPEAIFEEKDELDRVVGTWVLWKKVPYFFDSNPEDRHYKLDRALGQIQFGDGIHGQIPPAGQDNIRAFSYQAGGGAAGNILTGEIQTLSTAIAGVESVVNPVAADGGSDKATVEEMLDIGPGIISHRRRAVTIEDFELLAFEASRKIKKVRCLPNTNNNLQPETGWVTVIIVPESKDDEPQPSLVLRREVQRYLVDRCDGLVANREHIYVVGPIYEPIDLEVDIYAESIDVASKAENQARNILKKYFHPLTGGPQDTGWDFGRGLALSDLYALLEGIAGVDHIENLRFAGDSVKDEQVAKIAPNSLLASGSLTINMKTAENE